MEAQPDIFLNFLTMIDLSHNLKWTISGFEVGDYATPYKHIIYSCFIHF